MQEVFQVSFTSIEVSAHPKYLEAESEPHSDQFVWAYHITILNKSDEPVTLKCRYWRITDSKGITHEIKGKGVVGIEPTLQPGEKFSYTSGAMLNSPSGIMTGSYEMERPSGGRFKVKVPSFSLDSPHEKPFLN